jgi:3-hydroxyisobutyrate dehydrogenase
MGLEVAARLADAWTTLGTDLSAARRAAAAERGVETADLADVVARVEVVVLSLPTPDASHAVAQAIADDPGSVRVVLEMSTVTPADMAATQAILSPAGVTVLDAAVLAGVAQMRAGTAGLVLAGDRATIDALEPMLASITPNRRVLGEVGTGMAAKVLNNAVAHAVMVLLGEVMAMAVQSGLEPRALVDILAAEDGGLMRPLTHRVAERGFAADYEGGMSLEAARKDSVLALQMAQHGAVPVFTLPAAHAVYEMAMAQGWARQDYAALLQLWEGWGNFSLPEAAGPTP